VSLPVLSPRSLKILTVVSLLSGILGILTIFGRVSSPLAFGLAAMLLGGYPIKQGTSNIYKLLGGIAIILGVITIALWFFGTMLSAAAYSRYYY